MTRAPRQGEPPPRLPREGARGGQMPEAVFELSFRASERTVHHVRLMVQNFAMLVTGDHAYSSRLTVTCAELVESVARKSAGPCALRLRLDPADLAARAELTLEASERECRELVALIEEAGRGTAVEAYSAALTAQQDGVLGLARIRYEGQMALSLRRAGARAVIEASSTGRGGAVTGPRVEAA